jgi:hypothetical protein
MTKINKIMKDNIKKFEKITASEKILKFLELNGYKYLGYNDHNGLFTFGKQENVSINISEKMIIIMKDKFLISYFIIDKRVIKKLINSLKYLEQRSC